MCKELTKPIFFISLFFGMLFLVGTAFAGGDTIIIKSAKLQPGRWLHSCAENSATGKIYCFGGNDVSGGFLDQIIEYNPTMDITTIKVGKLPSGRFNLACVEYSLIHKIYCFGGVSNAKVLDEIVEYDPATDVTVLKSAKLPFPRDLHSCAEHTSTNRIYCFGGMLASLTDQIFEYDPALDKVTVKNAKLPSPRTHLSCAEGSGIGKVYCFGGFLGINGPATDQIVEYDPVADKTFIKSAKLPALIFGLSCAEDIKNKKIHCFNGGMQSPPFWSNQILEYKLAANSLKINKAILSYRTGHSCAENPLTNLIYCFGGWSGSAILDQIAEYTPPYAPSPVLLVHGIYSDDTIWTQVESSLQAAGFQVFKIGDALVPKQKGLVPNNGDITVLAGQVKQAIQNIKATGVSKVNVIAHSMGGLATRWYISQGGYQNDIDKLITLGTPNEGAPIAASLVSVLFGGLLGDDSADTAKLQMIPGSDFLNALNSNFGTQGVTHSEIAGTDTNNVALAATLTAINLLPFPYNIIFQLGFPYSYFFTVNDTVVPAASVNIPNISCYEHLNVHTDTLDFLNSPAYYDDSAVIAEAIKILNGGLVSFPVCGEPSTQSGTNVQNVSVNDSVSPGETKIAVNQDLGSKFTSSLLWAGGVLNQEFVSPTGVVVNASNYQNYGGVTYSQGTFSGSEFEMFEFAAPEQGVWTVKVIGTSIPAPTPFNLNVAFEDDVNIDFYTDKTNYQPNDAVILQTKLTDSLGPILNAGVEASIVDPAGVDTTITLRDDGLSNDVLANDGIYGNNFSGTGTEGTYNAGVKATTTQFQITDGDAFFVSLLPDLSVQSQNISFNPTILSKTEDNNVTVTATIFNIGDQDANNVEIDFYDGDPMKGGNVFATTSVSVLTGGSAQTQANLFIPKQKFIPPAGQGKVGGTALKNQDIHIIISSYSGFIEEDYSNNQANKLLKYGR